MADYTGVKKNKLRFKNTSESHKFDKERRRKNKLNNNEVILIPKDLYEESKKHGGWWIVDSYERIPNGRVCFQHDCGSYLSCSETGEIVLGDTHEDSDSGPSSQETFVLVKAVDNKYGLKTCYDRYVSVDSRGDTCFKTEAIGPQEALELVIQDGKVALQTFHGYFLSYAHGFLKGVSKKAASENEIFRMRTNVCVKKKNDLNEDELADPEICEMNYVKKFQSFGNQKLKVTDEPVKNLSKAKEEGKFYEEMLNRRERIKSDRYCK